MLLIKYFKQKILLEISSLYFFHYLWCICKRSLLYSKFNVILFKLFNIFNFCANSLAPSSRIELYLFVINKIIIAEDFIRNFFALFFSFQRISFYLKFNVRLFKLFNAFNAYANSLAPSTLIALPLNIYYY